MTDMDITFREETALKAVVFKFSCILELPEEVLKPDSPGCPLYQLNQSSGSGSQASVISLKPFPGDTNHSQPMLRIKAEWLT